MRARPPMNRKLQAEKQPQPAGMRVTITPGGFQVRKDANKKDPADKAVLLKADKVPADGFAIAEALAAELKGGNYDVIFFGKKAIDSGAETVGIMVAELLDLPCVPAVFNLDIQGGKGTVVWSASGGTITQGGATIARRAEHISGELLNRDYPRAAARVLKPEL